MQGVKFAFCAVKHLKEHCTAIRLFSCAGIRLGEMILGSSLIEQTTEPALLIRGDIMLLSGGGDRMNSVKSILQASWKRRCKQGKVSQARHTQAEIDSPVSWAHHCRTLPAVRTQSFAPLFVVYTDFEAQ